MAAATNMPATTNNTAIATVYVSLYVSVLLFLAVRLLCSMASSFDINHTGLPTLIALVPGVVVALVGLMTLGIRCLVGLFWLLVRWAPWGIGFCSLEAENGRNKLQVSAECHPGPSPFPGFANVSQEREAPNQDFVKGIPVWKAPGHSCVRASPLKADIGPPPPTLTSDDTESDEDLAVEARRARERDEAERKAAKELARAQKAAEGDKEWDIWKIREPEAYAHTRKDAIATTRHLQMASIQQQHELKLAEIEEPARMQAGELHARQEAVERQLSQERTDQQGSLVVMVVDREVEIVSILEEVEETMEVLDLEMVDVLGALEGQADAGSEFMELDSADATEDMVHAIFVEDDVAMESAQEAKMPSGMMEAEEMEMERVRRQSEREEERRKHRLRQEKRKREEEEEKRRDEEDKAEKERRQAEENERLRIAIDAQIAERGPAPEITDE
ncbi:hypothetical protein RUND412_002829 [Rhizina undulata]